jgi:hypothetical protein
MQFDTFQSLKIPDFPERSIKKASSNMHKALMDLLETCRESDYEREVMCAMKMRCL